MDSEYLVRPAVVVRNTVSSRLDEIGIKYFLVTLKQVEGEGEEVYVRFASMDDLKKAGLPDTLDDVDLDIGIDLPKPPSKIRAPRPTENILSSEGLL